MESIQLTKSSRPLGEISEVDGDVQVDNIPAEVRSVRFVLVAYREVQVVDPDSGSFIIKIKPEVRKIQDVPVTNGVAAADVVSDAGKFTMLAYGLIPTAGAASKVDFDNIHTPADEDFIGAIDLDQMVREGDLVETMTMGVNFENPAG